MRREHSQHQKFSKQQDATRTQSWNIRHKYQFGQRMTASNSPSSYRASRPSNLQYRFSIS